MKDSSPVWGSRFFLISGTKTYNSSLQTSPNSVHKNDTSRTSNSAGWNWLHIKLLHVSRLHQSIPGVEHTSTCERPDPGYRKEGRLHASLPLHQASQQKKKKCRWTLKCPQVPCRSTAKRPAVVLQLVEKHRAAFSVNTGLRAGTPTPK